MITDQIMAQSSTRFNKAFKLPLKVNLPLGIEQIIVLGVANYVWRKESRKGILGQVGGLTIILNIEMQVESSSACSGMIAPIKRSKRSSYAKISLKTKLQFFQRVLKEKGNIR